MHGRAKIRILSLGVSEKSERVRDIMNTRNDQCTKDLDFLSFYRMKFIFTGRCSAV